MTEPSTSPMARGPLFYIGALGVLLVMIVETVAVLGRHLNLPVIGSLEVIQAAILLAACSAMVSTTLGNGHAEVHLLTDRLPLAWRNGLKRCTQFLSAFYFVALCAGAIWLAVDFWNAHEHSEVLQISFRPLRVISAVCVAAIAGIYLYRAVAPHRATDRSDRS